MKIGKLTIENGKLKMEVRRKFMEFRLSMKFISRVVLTFIILLI